LSENKFDLLRRDNAIQANALEISAASLGKVIVLTAELVHADDQLIDVLQFQHELDWLSVNKEALVLLADAELTHLHQFSHGLSS